MIYDGEVVAQKSIVSGIEVELSNVKGRFFAEWREYGENIKVTIPESAGNAFGVGRCVRLELTPVRPKRGPRRTTGK